MKAHCSAERSETAWAQQREGAGGLERLSADKTLEAGYLALLLEILEAHHAAWVFHPSLGHRRYPPATLQSPAAVARAHACLRMCLPSGAGVVFGGVQRTELGVQLLDADNVG